MTYSYREQIEILKMIAVSEGERKTLDCPFCHGRKKFSLSKLDGMLLWNCFRASCGAKGSHQGQRSVGAIRRRLERPTEPVVAPSKVTPLPKITTSIFNHEPALEYVIQNNCLDAFNSGYINIRYAPAEKRVLFYTMDGKGAVGRSIAQSKYKWWTFGDVSQGYTIGKGDVAVVVEDIPSACSVSRLAGHVGIALLGTSAGNLKITMHLGKAIIVLDKDASSKAVSVAQSLGNGATVRYTDTDLKHLSVDEVTKVLMSSGLAAGPKTNVG
jgi:hypothetical protein